jgi:hypothetical protein
VGCCGRDGHRYDGDCIVVGAGVFRWVFAGSVGRSKY